MLVILVNVRIIFSCFCCSFLESNSGICKVNIIGIRNNLNVVFIIVRIDLGFYWKYEKNKKFLWNIFVLIVENLNILNLLNEFMLCYY